MVEPLTADFQEGLRQLLVGFGFKHFAPIADQIPDSGQLVRNQLEMVKALHCAHGGEITPEVQAKLQEIESNAARLTDSEI